MNETLSLKHAKEITLIRFAVIFLYVLHQLHCQILFQKSTFETSFQHDEGK